MTQYVVACRQNSGRSVLSYRARGNSWVSDRRHALRFNLADAHYERTDVAKANPYYHFTVEELTPADDLDDVMEARNAVWRVIDGRAGDVRLRGSEALLWIARLIETLKGEQQVTTKPPEKKLAEDYGVTTNTPTDKPVVGMVTITIKTKLRNLNVGHLMDALEEVGMEISEVLVDLGSGPTRVSD